MRAEVVIIGGGVMGSSVAYHLAKAGVKSVLVIERDPSYARASSALSASSIRQQFTTPACIRMSQFGIEFLRRADEHLSVEGTPAGLSLVERGYLYLANETNAAALRAAFSVQRQVDVPVRAFSASQLHATFSWLHTGDLVRGYFGMTGEGWFDGYSLLQAFKRKARELGVRYVKDEAVGLTRTGNRVDGVQTAGSGLLHAQVVVNAAGPNAAAVAAWAGFTIPVVPERRCVFVFRCPDAPANMPLVIDPHGIYVRPEGDSFITGGPATPTHDADPFSLTIDYAQFDDVIWPTLAARIPAFEQLKLTRAWAGHYEMNTFDHNALIGWAPGCEGFMLVTGFSGHGMQHSPAAGRGAAELIATGRFESLDLSTFTPARLLTKQPVVELNIT